MWKAEGLGEAAPAKAGEEVPLKPAGKGDAVLGVEKDCGAWG